MQQELERGKDGKINTVTHPTVAYFLTEDEKKIYNQVLNDYNRAIILFNKPRAEFNDRSVRTEIDMNERAFNSYIPPRSQDPDESWRAQTVRPITRNKLISIAAHVTANILYPNVFAQNDKDNEEKEAAQVMRDLIEWTIENSNYSRQFLMAVITALVDPVVIVHAEFAEVMRKVRDMQDDGTYSVSDIVDEILSGFQLRVLRGNELLIANVFESDIQRQRFLIRNQFTDYEEEKLIYGDNEKFKEYVKPGVRIIFDQSSETFYQVYDREMQGYMVNKVTYYNRSLDLELVFINGICVTGYDRPNPRKDKLYPFAKTGYEPLNNGQFFYYKSAANKLGSDQEIVDTLYNMVIDGTFLALMPPIALYGSEEVNSSVTIPGTVTSFRDPNVKMENMAPKSDIRAGLEMIAKVEQSISESSQDALQAGGNNPGPTRTAREVLLQQQNAKTALGLFGKMIGFLVEDIGKLMIGDILQHMTVGQLAEIEGDDMAMKFRSFLLHDKTIEGKKRTKKIEFTDKYLNSDGMTPDEMMAESFDILKAQGGPDADVTLLRVNPKIFRTLKYKIRVDPDQLSPKSKSLEDAMKLEAYDRLIQNPYVDQMAVTQDFLLDAIKPGESAKYMKKQAPAEASAPMGNPDGTVTQKGVNQNLVGQLTGSNSLAGRLSAMQ